MTEGIANINDDYSIGQAKPPGLLRWGDYNRSTRTSTQAVVRHACRIILRVRHSHAIDDHVCHLVCRYCCALTLLGPKKCD